MPLYTIIMPYKRMTKVPKHKNTNATGFILTPISATFPYLKPTLDDPIRMRPDPVHGAKRTWVCCSQASSEPFMVHVVGTRD